MSDDSTPLRDRLERIGRFSAANRRVIFAVVAVLIVASMGIAATSVYMSLGMELYIDDDSQVNQDWQEVKADDEFDVGNAVYVAVETDQLYDPETIRAIDRLDGRYTSADEFTSVTSLADVVRAGNGGEIPETQRGVRAAIDRTASMDPSAERLVTNLNPDPQTAFVIATYGEVDVPDAEDQYFGFLPGTEGGVVSETVADETDATWLPPHVDVTITGTPVFETAAFGLMLPEMVQLFAIAFAIIFTIVFLVMRGRVERTWEVALPLSTAIVALIYMLGMMGIVGFQFNAIMLGVLPIALGLGIDFSLQLHTRYIEERENGREPVDAAGAAARTTGNTLLLAMATTSIGLGALLVSAVPPTRQLGATAAFGVVAATALSLTYLVALLVHFDDGAYDTAATDGSGNDAGEATAADGRLERLVDGGSKAIAASPIVVLLVMVAAIGGGAAVYHDVPTTQEMLDYWPDIEEREDLEDLQDTAESPNVMYVTVEGIDTYSPATFRRASAFETAIEDHDDVNAAMSAVSATEMAAGGIPESRARLLETVDQQAENELLPIDSRSQTPNKILIQLFVGDVKGEEVRHLIDDIEAEGEWHFGTERVAVTGKPVVNRNVIENVTSGRDPMTLLSFGMAFLFLTAALRSARESALLIVSVAVSAVMLISMMMYLFEIPWNPLTVATGSIALGAGITYGIHVHERFKEEMFARGAAPKAAMREAMVKKSRPVIGSGTTTLFGFGVLGISEFPVLANFGIAVALAMTFALVTSFVFLPAAALTLATRTDAYNR
ncbi:RND superfamily permease [Natronomonas moolapensis 8.8.11]|uniref:RND superfamily permease n=1 Tax=Natronomonas moolapensis (strain DSM 18674 / CECT 7526 / JCM 14361 / 8.8.11) TaxID=268739 RepID=M1XSB5_NATM8|nr:MMPL family transporter [Natronomonas moolapensis]CCQ37245.1 RND superfamily permease [Natronomonas moolapensis 8.8.11]